VTVQSKFYTISLSSLLPVAPEYLAKSYRQLSLNYQDLRTSCFCWATARQWLYKLL